MKKSINTQKYYIEIINYDVNAIEIIINEKAINKSVYIDKAFLDDLIKFPTLNIKYLEIPVLNKLIILEIASEDGKKYTHIRKKNLSQYQ